MAAPYLLQNGVQAALLFTAQTVWLEATLKHSLRGLQS